MPLLSYPILCSNEQSKIAAVVADALYELNLQRSDVTLVDATVDQLHWNPEQVLEIVSSSDEHDRVDISKQILSELLSSTVSRDEWEQMISWNSIVESINAHKDTLVHYLGCMYSLQIQNAPDIPSSRLELLFHLATGLQQKRVQNLIEAAKSTTEDCSSTRHVGSDTGYESKFSLEMPSYFTDQQKCIAHTYCELLKADYEQRLRGMRQRIAILSASLKESSEEIAEDPCMEVAVNNSLNNLGVQTSREALIQQFYKPHSWMESKAIKNQGLARMNEKPVAVEDRGGRLNLGEKESRIQMPQWVTERTIATSPPTKSPSKNRRTRNPHSKQNLVEKGS